MRGAACRIFSVALRRAQPVAQHGVLIRSAQTSAYRRRLVWDRDQEPTDAGAPKAGSRGGVRSTGGCSRQPPQDHQRPEHTLKHRETTGVSQAPLSQLSKQTRIISHTFTIRDNRETVLQPLNSGEVNARSFSVASFAPNAGSTAGEPARTNDQRAGPLVGRDAARVGPARERTYS